MDAKRSAIFVNSRSSIYSSTEKSKVTIPLAVPLKNNKTDNKLTTVELSSMLFMNSVNNIRPGVNTLKIMNTFDAGRGYQATFYALDKITIPSQNYDLPTFVTFLEYYVGKALNVNFTTGMNTYTDTVFYGFGTTASADILDPTTSGVIYSSTKIKAIFQSPDLYDLMQMNTDNITTYTGLGNSQLYSGIYLVYDEETSGLMDLLGFDSNYVLPIPNSSNVGFGVVFKNRTLLPTTGLASKSNVTQFGYVNSLGVTVWPNDKAVITQGLITSVTTNFTPQQVDSIGSLVVPAAGDLLIYPGTSYTFTTAPTISTPVINLALQLTGTYTLGATSFTNITWTGVAPDIGCVITALSGYPVFQAGTYITAFSGTSGANTMTISKGLTVAGTNINFGYTRYPIAGGASITALPLQNFYYVAISTAEDTANAGTLEPKTISDFSGLDEIYVHCPQLKTQSLVSLNKSVYYSADVIAVIPIAVEYGIKQQYDPNMTLLNLLTSQNTDRLDFILTNSNNELLDFNGVDWSMSLVVQEIDDPAASGNFDTTGTFPVPLQTQQNNLQSLSQSVETQNRNKLKRYR